MTDHRALPPDRLWPLYDVESSIATMDGFRQLGESLTAKVKAERECLKNVAYGPAALEVMDIYRASGTGGETPLFMFIHGGYWRLGTRLANGYMAGPLGANGVTVASVDYGLAPDTPLDEIVRQCRAALVWLYEHAADYAIDRARIFVGGASAGGHLAAMVAAAGWQAAAGLPEDIVKGAVALSGLYDLEPLLEIEPNSWLRMDGETARRNSPVLHLPHPGTAMLLGYGGAEIEGFVLQTETYGARLKEAGFDTQLIALADFDHFDVAPTMAEPDSVLTRAILEMIGAA